MKRNCRDEERFRGAGMKRDSGEAEGTYCAIIQ
jgi:hypothetical protein